MKLVKRAAVATPETDEERFWSKVIVTPMCWWWTGSLQSKGYGQFRLDGSLVLAHRYAYEICFGPIPEDLQIDHLCLVRHCVNPAHLEPVTGDENIRRQWLARR